MTNNTTNTPKHRSSTTTPKKDHHHHHDVEQETAFSIERNDSFGNDKKLHYNTQGIYQSFLLWWVQFRNEPIRMIIWITTISMSFVLWLIITNTNLHHEEGFLLHDGTILYKTTASSSSSSSSSSNNNNNNYGWNQYARSLTNTRVVQLESIYQTTNEMWRKYHSSSSTNGGLWIDHPTDNWDQNTQTYKDSVMLTRQHKNVELINQNVTNILRNDIRYYILPTDSDISGCPFISKWQNEPVQSTCNALHEIGTNQNNINNIQFINSGAFNDVWKIKLDDNDNDNNNVPYVLKTGNYPSKKAYTPYSINQYARDAKILNEATSSKYVLNIYGYCGSSSIVEKASGTLQDYLYRKQNSLTGLNKLQIAYNIAQAIADMQLFTDGDENGIQLPTIVSADIKLAQFLVIPNSNIVKVNDFNRGRFLTSKTPPIICPFTMSNHHRGSTNRSPEEYTDNGQQTDKVDIYAMGSLFYTLLTGKRPFYEIKAQTAMNLIRDGKEVILPPDIEHSNDKYIQIIINVMKQCRQFNPNDRPNALQVASILQKELSNALVNEKE